jgi:hypothetical protein
MRNRSASASDPLGLSGKDLLYISLGVGTLMLTAAFTRRVAGNG